MNTSSSNNATPGGTFTSNDVNAAIAARMSDKRSQQRYLLERPIVAIPVGINGEPQVTLCVDGMATDLSAGGLRLTVHGLTSLPTKRIVVGVEAFDGTRHYATLEARSVNPTSDGLVIGGKFADEQLDPLHPNNIVPMFDATTRRLKPRTGREILDRWAEVGVLQVMPCDRVMVCPRCSAIPTFREGCRNCGSSNMIKDNLIHHYACAYVGPADEFRKDAGLACPKCHANRLVVGADFEHIPGAYRCKACSKTDNKKDLVAQCLGCDLRFPASQANEEEVVAYHVNRLDPLALLTASD